MRRYQLLAGAATLALGLVAVQSADAAVVQVASKQQLSAAPISFQLGTGTFSFTLDTTNFVPPGSDVATGGSGMITSFFGSVTDFGAGSTINSDPGLLYGFAAYPSASPIPDSQADDFVGFSYAGTGGTHYGFAEVFGTSFVGYAYETAANTAITTSPVPEPASAALLITGLAAVAFARRGKRANRRELTA